MNDSKGAQKALLIAAIACSLLAGLPFLNKPLHIDDTFVLAVAEQIAKHPLKPYSADFLWFSDPEPIFNITTNPPLVSYWLAPVVALFGPSEIALHLAMLPFLVLLALATAALSKRFAKSSLWPVFFVVFSPAVIVSTNIMRDVPAAALATGAVAVFVAGTDRERWSFVLAGSALAGLAMVAKYSALIIVPVLALYPLLQRKPRFLAGLLVGVAILGAWYLQNYLTHGQVHFFYLMTKKKPAAIDWVNKLTAALVITGASFILLPGLLAQAARRGDGATPSGAVVVAVGTALFIVAHYLNKINLQYYTWAITGAVLIYWMFATGLFASGRWWGRPVEKEALDSLFLLWWLIGPYVCGVFFVGFPAVRHILPAAAPIVLLGIRYLQRPEGPPNRWVATALGLGLAIQTVIAFWTAAADYQYADTYRRFAEFAKKTYHVEKDNKIWYYGHWGWQFYAGKEGFSPITQHGAVPKPGDIVLVPRFVHKGAMPPGLQERLEKIAEKRYPARLGVTTMDGWWRASFYATFGTTSPQYFGKGQTYEVFEVYRVKGKTK